jgi:hypothetical protein
VGPRQIEPQTGSPRHIAHGLGQLPENLRPLLYDGASGSITATEARGLWHSKRDDLHVPVEKRIVARRLIRLRHRHTAGGWAERTIERPLCRMSSFEALGPLLSLDEIASASRRQPPRRCRSSDASGADIVDKIGDCSDAGSFDREWSRFEMFLEWRSVYLMPSVMWQPASRS